MFHGLVYLPIILSLLGPKPYAQFETPSVAEKEEPPSAVEVEMKGKTNEGLFLILNTNNITFNLTYKKCLDTYNFTFNLTYRKWVVTNNITFNLTYRKWVVTHNIYYFYNRR